MKVVMYLTCLSRPRILFLLGSVVMLATGGCSDPRGQMFDKIKAANKTNIQKITSCYLIHHTLNTGKGPKSEEEFVEFCTSDLPYKKHFERIGVDGSQFEQYLTADNGEPLTIIYGVAAPTSENDGKPIVFGASDDDVFSVGFTDSTVKEVDQTEYDSLLKSAMEKKKKKK